MSNCWPDVKRGEKYWAKQWQRDVEVQDPNNKPWKNEALKKSDEDMPRLNKSDLEKVARNYKAKTGVGCDGFHPKVALDLTKETR